MRLGGVGLLVAVLALAGCKGGAPKPIEKKDPASPVSRTKGAGPAWLEDSMARLPGFYRSTWGTKGPPAIP